MNIPEHLSDYIASDGTSIYSLSNGDFLEYEDLAKLVSHNVGVAVDVDSLKRYLSDCPDLDWGERCGYVSDSSGWSRGMDVTEIEKLIAFIEVQQA